MDEYGLFNDEGCVERGLWSQEQAHQALQAYSLEDELTVHRLCSEHEEQPADTCEECAGE